MRILFEPLIRSEPVNWLFCRPAATARPAQPCIACIILKKSSIATIHINIPDQQAAALQAYVQARGLTLEQWFLQFAEQSVPAPPSEAPSVEPARRHISELILERMSKIPHEMMATMPVDGASQHDHYIYGLPKRD